MSNRTGAIIITIVAVLLCGCPGLLGVCWGLVSLVDFAGGFGVLATDQNTYYTYIFSGLCGGILLVAIAVVVGFLVLRKKKEGPPVPPVPPVPPISPDEPLPPAI